MNVLRRLCSIFLALAFVFMALLPVCAEEKITRSFVKDKCDSLETVIYPSVYQNVTGYADYVRNLLKTKAVCADPNASDIQLENAYNELRASYLFLLRNTYDYSGISFLASLVPYLKSGLYEEEDLSVFLTEVDKCVDLYEHPQVYLINNMSREEYISYIQSKIDALELETANAFKDLFILQVPENLTRDDLAFFYLIIAHSIRPDSIPNVVGSEDFYNALNAAGAVLDDPDSTNEDIQKSGSALLKSYHDFMRSNFNFSELDLTVSTFKNMRETDYTEEAFEKIRKARMKYDLTETHPILFYVPTSVTSASYKEYVQDLIGSINNDLMLKFSSFVTVQRVEYLKSLIEKYKNITPHSNYESALVKAVKKGVELLENNDYDSQKVEESISLIEDTAKKAQEASGTVSAPSASATRSQWKSIITYTVITLLLSLALAVFLSIREYGRIDFTK